MKREIKKIGGFWDWLLPDFGIIEEISETREASERVINLVLVLLFLVVVLFLLKE